jgi:hypothetical protein
MLGSRLASYSATYGRCVEVWISVGSVGSPSVDYDGKSTVFAKGGLRLLIPNQSSRGEVQGVEAGGTLSPSTILCM